VTSSGNPREKKLQAETCISLNWKKSDPSMANLCSVFVILEKTNIRLKAPSGLGGMEDENISIGLSED
jgi:hypothetical protein